MEFGKHIGKGIWGLADKALPVVYGLAYVVLVIRVLPAEEFGNFVLIQEIFLIITGLAAAFALQPLLKFAAEGASDASDVVGAALVLNLVFIVLSAMLSVAASGPAGRLLNSPSLTPLMLYLPAMLAASFIRNFVLVLLQARFMIREVFWTDAAHFLGAPVLIWVYSRMHLFDSALDLIEINVLSLSASSMVALFLARKLIVLSLRPEKTTVRKMWDYGKYSFGGIVSYLFYSKADSFILSAFSGPVEVAVYNSVKVFGRVFEMISQIVQMFVLPAVSRLSWQGETRSLKALVEKSIMFFTIALIPVFLIFLGLPGLLVQLLYQGRYADAVPILQIFSLLSFVVPLLAVGSNMLLGLGQAKQNFVLGLQMLFISTGVYLIFIPILSGVGAALAYVLASYILAGITAVYMNKFVPITLREVLRRTNDAVIFVQSRLGRFRAELRRREGR